MCPWIINLKVSHTLPGNQPQLSWKIVPHGHRDQHCRHEKLKPTAGSPAPLFPLLPWKRNPIPSAQLCAPGSFGLQWLIGLSLLAFLPLLNLWGREPDVPIWPAIVVVSSNVQLFQALFTECLIYLGFPNAKSKLLEEKGMLLTSGGKHETGIQEMPQSIALFPACTLYPQLSLRGMLCFFPLRTWSRRLPFQKRFPYHLWKICCILRLIHRGISFWVLVPHL